MSGARPTAESAIDIVVEHPVIAALPYWRATAETGVPPHVTLLYPWRTPPIDDAGVVVVADALRPYAPFTLSLSGIATFPTGVVYAVVEPDSLLRTLARALRDAFPETPPYRGQFGDQEPVPHVTLAKCDPAELARLVAEVENDIGSHLPLTIPIATVSIQEQSAAGQWSVTHTLELTSLRGAR